MKIQGGTGPSRTDHRDRDLHLSFGNTGASVSFPGEFFTDSIKDMPDQMADGQPFGCTNYSQARLATNLLKGLKVFLASVLEAVTRANKKGGYDIRQSLLAAKGLGWFTGFYNIKPSVWPPMDYFDALRLAQIAGMPENRSISVGFPWMPSWELATQGEIMQRNLDGTYTLLLNPAGKQIIMPMPTEAELNIARTNPNSLPWHNSVLPGWTTKGGVLLYQDVSFQGPNIGEGGYVYFPREVINVVMNIKGAVAFTATNQTPANVQTVDLNAIAWIVSFIRNALGL